MAVNFMVCFFLLLASGHAWTQTPIQEGKFILEDSTFFFVAYDVKWNNYRVMDRETYPYFRDYSAMPLEDMLIGEMLAKHKLVSVPSLQEICEKTFQRKSSLQFFRGKKSLLVDVHLNPVSLEIWSVSFLLPKKNNNVTLEDLAAIRHAIHQYYRPKVVSETDFYIDYYDYLSDYVSLFYDEDE